MSKSQAKTSDPTAFRSVAAQDAPPQSHERFREIYDHAPFGIFHATPEGKVIDVNPAYVQIMGYNSAEELIEMANRSGFAQVMYVYPDRRPIFVEKVIKSGGWHVFENQYKRKDGRIITCKLSFRSFINSANGQQELEGFIEDITEHKLAQQERDITIEFLRIMNESTETRNMIQAVTTFFQRQSECQAVGVRLKEGDDYPYYEARGFSQEFVFVENSLCSRDKAGDVVHDSSGYPIMECMCGNVICGRFDPSKPFFTAKGSFWTNCTTELLANTSETDRQARTRNRCNGEGYESVALIPLRIGDQRLGLLQLNDRRKGMFSLEIIALWERLADYLAVAIAKFWAEEALRESEHRYRGLFESMVEGFALCEMIYDAEGKPVDYRHIKVNCAYTMLTELPTEKVIGHTIMEILPRTESFWIETYGRVVETGQPERIEHYSAELKKCYEVYAWKSGPGHFAIIFSDVTKRAEFQNKLSFLTDRERQVMEMIISGKSDKEIAVELGISQRAISFHRTHILEKMHISSVAELAEQAGEAKITK